MQKTDLNVSPYYDDYVDFKYYLKGRRYIDALSEIMKINVFAMGVGMY